MNASTLWVIGLRKILPRIVFIKSFYRAGSFCELSIIVGILHGGLKSLFFCLRREGRPQVPKKQRVTTEYLVNCRHFLWQEVDLLICALTELQSAENGLYFLEICH